MNNLTESIYKNVTINKLIKVIKSKGYKVYTIKDKHPINIINVRNSNRKAGKFDDTQILFYYQESIMRHNVSFYDVTVDPSTHYLLNPINKSGTAIVPAGQHLDIWKLGLHKGKYKALVQVNKMPVIRDANKDNILDIPLDEVYSKLIDFKHTNDKFFTVVDKQGKSYLMEYGYFGINCHRASSWKILDKIGLYSAGCTVHQDPNAYNDFIAKIEYNSKPNDLFSPIWISDKDLLN